MEDYSQDLRQTKQWAKYLQDIGWVVEKVPDYLYIKKLPFLPWSIAKLQRAKNVDEKLLKQMLKKHKVIKLIKTETVACKSIWIDLTKTRRQLLKEMKAKTRYNIGLAKRRGVIIKIISGKEILATDLYKLIKANAKRVGIFKMPEKWFEEKIKAFGSACFAVMAYKDGELVAGNMFFVSKTCVFYFENGSTLLGRKLMAPSLCVWKGMLEAKRRNIIMFDFEGIYDGTRSLKRWRGFTRFKKGFGGREITFS